MLRIVLVVMLALLVCTGAGWAGAITVGGGWYEFNWSSLEPIPPENPFTFTTPPEGATLKVTDAFVAGDQFEVFRDSTSLGLTPWVPATSDWTNNPDYAYSDPRWSHRAWYLPGGEAVNINIDVVTNPYGYGTGYLRVDAGVPEPGTVLLLGAGLLALAAIRRHRLN
jgi:hypothetical protein